MSNDLDGRVSGEYQTKELVVKDRRASSAIQNAPIAQGQPMSAMALVQHAVMNGGSIDVIERLIGLQERWEKEQSRKAFEEAISLAKSEIPVIVKDQKVDYASRDGTQRTNYAYEDIGSIARIIDPILSKYGLSYRFRTESLDRGIIKVTCRVAHKEGYSEETSLPAPPDAGAGKNPIQAIGSTITYLQRYLLKSALGLAASKDDDGQSAGSNNQQECAAKPQGKAQEPRKTQAAPKVAPKEKAAPAASKTDPATDDEASARKFLAALVKTFKTARDQDELGNVWVQFEERIDGYAKIHGERFKIAAKKAYDDALEALNKKAAA